jgi:hypothetical protein
MSTPLLLTAAAIVVLHGLIHLLGFVTYWPLGDVPSLPYKTALFEGRLEVGAAGMQIFAVLWLFAAIGFVVAVLGFARDADWWIPAIVVITLVSLALTVADWRSARVGAMVDGVLLVALLARGALTSARP